ncbi:MAG: type II secretion system protein [Candidatus Sungbacteria bacterium]|uniref:Type II secretion system protein n=1 Tax=Candidatus Sungiibacteriota bacterium TaxID=2750080 RepID=A0A932YXF0_9BACT|nr:type II secretion system protein [Candidatus Sungbacteria bacterium]
MPRRERRGFTLIELLVVIAIIGVLASIVLASLNTARRKSRDARRVGDVRQMQLALELYFDANNGAYPANTGLLSGATACGTGACIPAVPTDPVGNTAYPYAVCSPATSYHLGTGLEDSTNPALQSDADAPTGTCGGTIAGADTPPAGNERDASCVATVGGTRWCYDVRP